MKILAMDSSAISASVCITEDGKVLGSSFVNIKQTHSQTLMVMVEQVLKTSNTALEDIDLFAVSAGPGSFTGVRIGVSCVKGMAMALNKPCAGISTLEAMAMQCAACEGVICAVMDARCGQVYNALFTVSGGKVARITEDRAISINDLAEECSVLSGNIFLMGDGATICMANDKFKGIENVRIMPEHCRFQRAEGVACAALEAEITGGVLTAAELQPVYLRLPQAERELKKKQQEDKS